MSAEAWLRGELGNSCVAGKSESAAWLTRICPGERGRWIREPICMIERTVTPEGAGELSLDSSRIPA